MFAKGSSLSLLFLLDKFFFSQVVLQDFIEDVKRKNRWKSDLRSQNQRDEVEEGRPEEEELRKLDSSLKKNTAFIRKLVRKEGGI